MGSAFTPRSPLRRTAPAEGLFFFQAEDGIRDVAVTGVQTCALPIFDGRLGNRLDNSTEQFRCLLGICRGRRDATAPLAEQARAVAAVSYGLETGYFEEASFVKLRELSLTYFAPAAIARHLGASALSVSVTGRNLATWTNYSGIDPELNDAGQSNFNTAEFLTQPPVRYFIARINLTF